MSAPRPAHIHAVLCNPVDVRNVAGAIRAVCNYGWASLRVVSSQRFDERDLLCFSSEALSVTEVRFFEEVPAAIADCGRVVGTSRRLRTPDAPPCWPASGLAARLPPDVPTAILFGTERTGLTRAEVDLCAALVEMPTTETFPSMNLAHAVACVGYELARPAPERVGPPVGASVAPRRVSAPATEAFFGHVYRCVAALGYPPGRNPELFVRRVRRLLERANPSQPELGLLGGVFSEMLRLGRLGGVAHEVDDEGE